MAYTREEFINTDDLLQVLGEEYFDEGLDDETILKKVWREYKVRDWAEHGFYKVDNVVYDMECELDEFRQAVSPAVFNRACKLSGRI